METPENEQFRDSIGTINEQGKRSWVYPKKPSGKFYKYRTYVSYFLLAFLVSAPFIKINGNQFLLFNVLERKFNIFSFPFWPQDFHLLVISMITGVVFVILFTVVFGRIFCGWICPQTIFLEMVFRKIEYWIDGDRGKQIRLEKQPWNAEKIRKRVLKWFTFFIISFLIANVFLAYLIGGDTVINYITGNLFDNVGTLISLLIFTGVFYFVFTWFREQVCIIACPYGRLQGVLLDNKTINIAYDYVRGEGKKGRAKKAAPRVDLTPMVDLAYLLITFFMFTTTLAKPKAMQIVLPDTKTVVEDPPPVDDDVVITTLLAKDNRIIYYHGSPDKAASNPEMVKSTTFDKKTGIRKIILDKQKAVAALPNGKGFDSKKNNKQTNLMITPNYLLFI